MSENSRRIRVSRLFFRLAVFAGAWACAIALSGGFSLDLGAFQFTSMNPRKPAWVATVFAGLAWLLAAAGTTARVLLRTRTAAVHLWSRWIQPVMPPASRIAQAMVTVACVTVTTLGFLKGAFVVGGADSFGYVSQARLWAQGRLHLDQPILKDWTWWLAHEVVTPLGYRPSPQRDASVPAYSPGYPMAMAVFERLIGPEAVFWVVPLFGSVAVWATYLLGRHFAGHVVGAGAAVLLATSPVFLLHVMFPMSDVPVTAWWTLCLALLPPPTRLSALASGLAAGAAILTRPNIAPLVVVPIGYLAFRMRSERSLTGLAAQRALLFGIPAGSACVAIAGLNAVWYGSPWTSGYGPISYLYESQHFWPNVSRYGAWLFQTHTPGMLLGLAAPWLVRHTVRYARAPENDRRALVLVYLSFAVATFACYVFYAPFESWSYLRFLLPAFPPLLVLMTFVLAAIASRTRKAPTLVTVVLVGLFASHGVSYSRRNAVFHVQEGQRQYKEVGEYIARTLPSDAALVTMQHSGSARFYSGRQTIRYDWIPPKELDAVMNDLQRIGYHPFIVLYDWEEREFRSRFRNDSAIGALDWAPVAISERPTPIRIYDAANEGRQASPDRHGTDIIR